MTTVLVSISQPPSAEWPVHWSLLVRLKNVFFWSEESSANTMPSVLLLFLYKNEGFSKSQVRKICAVVDAILQRLSVERKPSRARSSVTLSLERHTRDCRWQQNNCARLLLSSKSFVRPSASSELVSTIFHLSVLTNIPKSVYEVPRILHRLSSQIPIDSVVI